MSTTMEAATHAIEASAIITPKRRLRRSPRGASASTTPRPSVTMPASSLPDKKTATHSAAVSHRLRSMASSAAASAAAMKISGWKSQAAGA